MVHQVMAQLKLGPRQIPLQVVQALLESLCLL